MRPAVPLHELVRSAGLVARREYRVRVRSLAFAVSTAILAAVAVAMGVAPVAIRALERTVVVRIAVSGPDATTTRLSIAALDFTLNGSVFDPSGTRPYRLSEQPDPAAGRAQVADGRLDGFVIVSQGANAALDVTYVTRNPGGRVAQLLNVVAFAIAANVRADEARGFVGRTIVEPVGATVEGPPPSPIDAAGRSILSAVLLVLLFITSVSYGMWIAASVAEEKATRVIELILNAATPGEILAGKVIGVGAAGLTQLAAILVSAGVALALQGPLAGLVLGEASPALPGGLTPGILLGFATFFVLGFLLSAFLYAAAGALVSRQEDVQQVAMPMLMVSFVAYFAAFFASTGIDAPWVAPLSMVPFFSPYLVVTRLVLGTIAPWELALAAGLMLVAIGFALVAAVRVYRAAILMTGQRATFGRLVALVRRSPRG